MFAKPMGEGTFEPGLTPISRDVSADTGPLRVHTGHPALRWSGCPRQAFARREHRHRSGCRRLRLDRGCSAPVHRIGRGPWPARSARASEWPTTSWPSSMRRWIMCASNHLRRRRNGCAPLSRRKVTEPRLFSTSPAIWAPRRKRPCSRCILSGSTALRRPLCCLRRSGGTWIPW